MKRRQLLLAALPATGLLSSCSKKNAGLARLPSGTTVLALGDSLTQGVGSESGQPWPALLQERSGWLVINAGVSGDTSAQALQRLPGLLERHHPDLVLLGIGGNDFLRQLSVAETRRNIQNIGEQVLASGAQLLLIAMPKPSLLAAGGGRLRDHPLYGELGQAMQVPVYAGGWSRILSQDKLRSDRIHANAAGYRQFASGLSDYLRDTGWLQ